MVRPSGLSDFVKLTRSVQAGSFWKPQPYSPFRGVLRAGIFASWSMRFRRLAFVRLRRIGGFGLIWRDQASVWRAK